MNLNVSTRAYPGGVWYEWITRLLRRTDLTPFRIALIYLGLGMTALFVSDVIFVQYLSEPLLSQAQSLKGGAEVVLTTGLIYVFTRRSRNQVTEANDRLEEQSEELHLLHRVLRHNLRNDINMILGYANLIRDRGVEEEVLSESQKIASTASKMATYTEQAQQIRKVTGQNSHRVTVDLAERIPELLDDNSVGTREIETTVRIPPEARVEVNQMFVEAVDELIGNAIEHNDSDAPELTVEVTEDPTERWIEVRIVDNGPGIPDSEIEMLARGTDEQVYHLSGMGLWFVNWTVAHSDGNLVVQSDTEGTEVCVKVPRAVNMPLQSLDKAELVNV